MGSSTANTHSARGAGQTERCMDASWELLPVCGGAESGGHGQSKLVARGKVWLPVGHGTRQLLHNLHRSNLLQVHSTFSPYILIQKNLRNHTKTEPLLTSLKSLIS